MLEITTVHKKWRRSGMITRLCQANAVVGEAQDFETPPASNGEHLRTRYDAILSKAEAGNPPRPHRSGTRRGRIKQSPAYNLIRRLRECRNEILRFLIDLRVPFDNDQAECNLRMPKFKQKASGCFRSDTGARGPCRHPLLISQLSANNPTIFSTRSS